MAGRLGRGGVEAVLEKGYAVSDLDVLENKRLTMLEAIIECVEARQECNAAWWQSSTNFGTVAPTPPTRNTLTRPGAKLTFHHNSRGSAFNNTFITLQKVTSTVHMVYTTRMSVVWILFARWSSNNLPEHAARIPAASQTPRISRSVATTSTTIRQHPINF